MKMRRIVVTMLVLAMMLVYLPMQASAEEQRETLLPKTMEQLQSISVDSDGVIVFSTMDDFELIISEAEKNPQYLYETFYFGSSGLTFKKSMTIPKNVFLSMWSGKLTVNTGKKLTFNGSAEIGHLDLQGTMVIGENSVVRAVSTVKIGLAGRLDLHGTIYMPGIQSFDKESITYGENAMVITSGSTFTADESVYAELEQIAANYHPNWYYKLCGGWSEVILTKPMTIPKNCVIYADGIGRLASLEGHPMNIEGALVCYMPIDIDCDLNIMPGGTFAVGARTCMGGKIKNLGTIEIATDWGDYTGQLEIPFDHYYSDTEIGATGQVLVMAPSGMEYPNYAFTGVDVNHFSVEWEESEGISCWTLQEYCVPHEHVVVKTPYQAPTCLESGCSEGAYCSDCGEILVYQEILASMGHDYGLDEDGNPDFWDTTCDVCGAERKVDTHRPTHSMYRMYNPNSGEHFYTGSMEERKNLEDAGWKYEGVGFTFPATTGKPVYRLYDKNNTFEHLYTMDEVEKEKLLAEGWVLEGIAFNSGREDEVPQYRLHNPNATIGAYHFTASVEEKDSLIAAGWEYQGIGFYTCLQ